MSDDLTDTGVVPFPPRLEAGGGVPCDFPEGGREVGGVSGVALPVGGASSPAERSSPFFFFALGLACDQIEAKGEWFGL